MAKRVPSRGSEQFMLRLPDGMRDQIREKADQLGVSMNSQIVNMLEVGLDAVPELYREIDQHAAEIERLNAEIEKLTAMLDERQATIDVLKRSTTSPLDHAAMETAKKLAAGPHIPPRFHERMDDLYAKLKKEEVRGVRTYLSAVTDAVAEALKLSDHSEQFADFTRELAQKPDTDAGDDN